MELTETKLFHRARRLQLLFTMLGVCFVVPFLALATAVPVARETNFIGEGTSFIASALLQGHAEQSENMVFSPLGLNAILAIFAEGSRGTSRSEIAAALHFPDDVQAVRNGYQTVLRRLSERNKPNTPEMKNWFYVYKNYTVQDELKNVLQEFYLTEVKLVNRPDEYFGPSEDKKQEKTPSQEPNKVTDEQIEVEKELEKKPLETQELEKKPMENEKELLEGDKKIKVPAGLQGKPTDHLIDVDKEVESIIGAASSPHKSDGEEAATNHQPTPLDTKISEENKSGVMMEGEKKPTMPEDQMMIESKPAEVVQQETIKTEDKMTDNVRDIVKPVEEQLPGSLNSNEKTQLSEKDKDELKKEDNPVVNNEKKEEHPVLGNEKKDTPVLNSEKKEDNEIKVDHDKKVQEEMMVAMQKRSIQSIDDMSGMTDSAVKIKSNGSVSQMIIFNGLYFKGDWDAQFVKKPAEDSKPFYKANKEKVFVKTLHAEGLFETADIPELKSRAVEIKYQGGRYSLLLVLPNEIHGLDQLISDIAHYPISRIYENLEEKLLALCLPAFEITSITKPVGTPKKMGLLNVNTIFNPETADLSGISANPGLFVEELVQLVVFSVDSNFTEANFLTASIASSRSDMESVKVNHPFLFYLRDNVDGIIIVNGKLTDPTHTEEDMSIKTLRNAVRNAVE